MVLINIWKLHLIPIKKMIEKVDSSKLEINKNAERKAVIKDWCARIAEIMIIFE